MSARFKFGDIIENGWASEDNPKKRGVYLWSFTRTGRMNPGKHVKLRYEDGKTGELPISDDGKLTVVGTIFDAAIEELEADRAEQWRLRREADASLDLEKAVSKAALAAKDAEIEKLKAALREIASTEEYRGLSAEEAMSVAQRVLRGEES